MTADDYINDDPTEVVDAIFARPPDGVTAPPPDIAAAAEAIYRHLTANAGTWNDSAVRQHSLRLANAAVTAARPHWSKR